MRILIVGGSGLIGRAVARALAPQHEVTILDPRDPEIETVAWIRGDARDPAVCRRAVDDQEWVFIKTGLMGGLASFDSPLDYHDLNVRLPLQVQIAAAEAGVRRVVFDSSETVFGPDDPSPHREEQLPHPHSVYGCTKFLMECYLRTSGRLHDLDWLVFRYPRVVSSEGDNIVTRLHRTIAEGGPCRVVRGQGQTIDLVHIDDVVRAHELAIQNDARCEVLHVAPGGGEAVRAIVDRCIEASGVSCEIVESPPPQAGEPAESDLYHEHMVLDNRRIRERFGWVPRSVSETIDDTFAKLAEASA